MMPGFDQAVEDILVHFALDDPRASADLVVVNDPRLVAAGSTSGESPP